MSSPESAGHHPPVVDLHGYSAALFDLDGVLTPTAEVHMRAWQQMFFGVPDRPRRDRAVHGQRLLRLRRRQAPLRGVRSFLESRGIDLPEGTPEDPPEAETVCGLGNRKNDFFAAVLADRRGQAVSRFGRAAGRVAATAHQAWPSSPPPRTPPRCSRRRAWPTGSRWWSTVRSRPPRGCPASRRPTPSNSRRDRLGASVDRTYRDRGRHLGRPGRMRRGIRTGGRGRPRGRCRSGCTRPEPIWWSRILRSWSSE